MPGRSLEGWKERGQRYAGNGGLNKLWMRQAEERRKEGEWRKGRDWEAFNWNGFD